MIILVGAGGNAIDAISFKFRHEHCLVLVDDAKEGKFMGFDIIGKVERLLEPQFAERNKGGKFYEGLYQVYNCIGSAGDNSTRNEVYRKLTDAGLVISNLVLTEFVAWDVKLGNNILIGLNAQIHHGSFADDNVVISPGAIVLGDVTIGDNAFIGAGAILRQGITIGQNAVVGMGAVITKDVPPGETWVGNPGRRLV